MKNHEKRSVGILTFTNVINYGATLQEYALAERIKELGFSVQLIDYRVEGTSRKVNLYKAFEESVSRIRAGDFKNLFSRFKIYKGKVFTTNRKKVIFQPTKTKPIELKFKEFWTEISHTEKKYDKAKLFENPPQFDIYVTGSDQVWNYRRTNDIDSFFLRFVPKGKKKISFAASFGVPEIPFFFKRQYIAGLANLNEISVREDSGVRLVKKLINKNVYHVLDPTLLLKSNDWRAISKEIDLPENYVLIYSLTITANIITNAKKIASNLGAEVVWLGTFRASCIPNDIQAILDAGPKEFLHVVSHATFVITDSFHGTAFSISFGKQFVFVGDRYNKQVSRSLSLLKSLGLDDFIIEDVLVPNDFPSKQIEYEKVNPILEEKRNDSMLFLNNALNV